MTAKNPLRIGVFIPAGAQLLDLSSIDLFAMLRPEYLAACKLPAPLVSLGVPSTIHYISMPSTGSHMQLTASAFIRVSKTTEDPEVQPGMLDILLIPGPDPSVVFEEEVLGFLRRHAEWKGEGGGMTDILGVCTSCYLMAQSGILKGHTTCGPRALIPELRKRFPDSKWIDDKRWTKGGNIWNSGGITNGHEMVAAYIRENFPGPAAEAALAMADVGDKGSEYTNSRSGETFWWLWQILKAMTVGNGKSKKLSKLV